MLTPPEVVCPPSGPASAVASPAKSSWTAAMAADDSGSGGSWWPLRSTGGMFGGKLPLTPPELAIASPSQQGDSNAEQTKVVAADVYQEKECNEGADSLLLLEEEELQLRLSSSSVDETMWEVVTSESDDDDDDDGSNRGGESVRSETWEVLDGRVSCCE